MTETTRETRYTLLDAARCDGPAPSGVSEVSSLQLRQCVADAERLAEIEAALETTSDCVMFEATVRCILDGGEKDA